MFEQVQYDGKDDQRIISVAQALALSSTGLLHALAEYGNALEGEADEDSVYRTKTARQDLVFAWTDARIVMDAVADVVRIDKEEALRRRTADPEATMEGI